MQDPEEADMPVPRERLLEAAWPEMPYGESGEAAPSLIPYQVMSHSDSISAWGGCLFRHTFGVTGIAALVWDCGHECSVFVNSTPARECDIPRLTRFVCWGIRCDIMQ